MDTGFPFKSRSKSLKSITFNDFGSTQPKLIVIWGPRDA
jgi:hypothetical protein